MPRVTVSGGALADSRLVILFKVTLTSGTLPPNVSTP